MRIFGKFGNNSLKNTISGVLAIGNGKDHFKPRLSKVISIVLSEQPPYTVLKLRIETLAWKYQANKRIECPIRLNLQLSLHVADQTLKRYCLIQAHQQRKSQGKRGSNYTDYR
jgi:hypothetical protein